MTMHNTTATEPTWITAARAATAARRAAEAERAARQAAEDAASTRRVFLQLLAECGIPTDHADLTTDPRWGLVAVVDGYRFTRGDGPASWTVARLIACPICTQEVLTSDRVYPESSRGASLGALFTDAEPRYHHCPGRPVGPEDYDEEGELIDRTPRPTPPPPPPSTGERLLAALADYIAEQEASR
jgi:hypothetical protein